MDECVWSDQWGQNIMHLHRLVASKNKMLVDSGITARIISRFVDAVWISELTELAQKHDHIFLITEQAFTSPAKNITVVHLPCSFYGLYLYDFVITDTTIKKEFNCLINRNDPIRQSWFYLLFARKFLDQGFVSFNLLMRDMLSYPEQVSSGSEYFDWIHQSYLSSFDMIRADIEKIVPYKNFDDTGDLTHIVMGSKFSIILETYFERPDCKVFSEKTLRALHFPRPWVLFAATGCVQRLRNFGFDVFDNYVDHSYDSHDTSSDCVARQEAILEQCTKLQELTVTEDILIDWQRKAEHNRSLLQQWQQTYITDLELLLEKVFETAKLA